MQEPTEAPVIILGLHRSGTTLLYQMLAAGGCFKTITALHVISFDDLSRLPQVWDAKRTAMEERFRQMNLGARVVDAVELAPRTPEEYGFILSNLGAGWTIKRRNLHLFQRLVDLVRRVPAGPGRPLLKNPWDFSRGQVIHRLLPGVKLVYIHRNPFHVLSSTHRVISMMMTRSNPYLAMLSEPYRRFESSEFPRRVAMTLGRRWPGATATAIIECMAHWVRVYLRQREEIPTEARMDVRFEDLCATPNETIGSILGFLGVSAPPRDYSAMIGPHMSKIAPEMAWRSARIVRRFGKYASWAGYDLRAAENEAFKTTGGHVVA